MTKAPELREIFTPPDEILRAGLDGNLVLFVGAGVSMRLGLPSWDGLALAVLNDLRESEHINFNYADLEQLRTLDAKQQLSIASIIAEKNGHDLDIRQYLIGKREGNSIYKAINDIGCPCVTTNYDELLSPRYTKTMDGSSTPVDVNRVSDKEKFYAKLLKEPGTVVHLHGSVGGKMIITTSDYLQHYDHEKVQTFLGELFSKKVVLFLGYGLEEAEILEHILRRGKVKQTSERKRFALQGFFRSQQPLYENLHSYYKKSFGVHLLGFMRDHDDYKTLDYIIQSWNRQLVINEPPLMTDVEFMNEVLEGD